jgi:predicted nucleic acid-binding protein
MPGAPTLDSYALLAFLRDETGSETVAKALERASQHDQPVHMTELSYAEVQYFVRTKGGDSAWNAIAKELTSAPIDFHPADRRLTDLAIDIKLRYDMSIAASFAAALAKERKAELLTGDPVFKALEKEIKIKWLT